MDTTYLLNQLSYQAPMFLAAPVGMILALVNWGRYPTPAVLTVVGCVLVLLVGITQPVVSAVLTQQMRDGALRPEQFGQMLTLNALACNSVRACGFGLVLIAVFAARAGERRPDRRDRAADQF